jgi:nitrate reductase delta subunit
MERTQLTAAYRLIAELFVYPEERDAALIEAEMISLGDAPAELREPIQAFLDEPSSASAEEYVATLELAPPVPLYLGSYLYGEPESCRGAGMSGRNGYMLQLSNIYRHFGVELGGAELSDFVPVIVEFLGMSLERRDADQIGLRRYFVETLLLNAIESLLSALRKYESPYAHLVEALRIALADDIAQMAGGPKWQAPADSDRTPVPVDLRNLTASNQDAPENWVEL